MSKAPRNVVMKAAHRKGLPVAVSARRLAAQYPTMDDAAASIGTDGKCLARYINGTARMRSRLVALADRRGMDTAPFVIEMVEQFGTPQAAAAALGVSIDAIRGTLRREGVTLRPSVPKYTKARMLQLLRDGFKASDVARMLDMSVNTTYYYAGKIKRMKRTMRRWDAA
jgi:hypothetical protein